ncbi:sodium:solute symporter family protein [Thermanaeromonas sp. C210]|uniref:sodium:solute symporter family protein n=1 Tax=Thermanaeromonas sp. C210 TaxID=2731925 RepID=UPI00155C09D3|nr:sodium:solute symporter family protein [Thermanaeromonas sp. C210]GFN22297.1 solute:Na+ symporter, SSS family protein [Thermanaeromonas sp. C210]
MLNSTALLIVILYLIGMLGIGWYTNRFLIKNSTDYMLASRALPAIMVAASLSVNNIGGGSSVGVASRAFGNWGLSAGWYVLAAAIGIIPMALFAPRLRRVLAYTIPEVVGRRFGPTSHLITAVLNIVALFCLTASQILASGTIVAALTGIPLDTGIIIAGLVAIIYTVMGGLWADAFTDLFQWIIIFFGLLIALPFIIGGAGGWQAIVSKVPPAKMSLTGIGFATILSLVVQYFITFMSGPEMVSRIYAAKDEREGTKATLLSALFMALYAFIPALIGIVAFATFPNINGNQALATVVFNLAPSWVAGLVCAAIIASTMSSADSDMLCASTIFTKDIYQRYINPQVSDRAQIIMTRIGNVVIGLVAMGIALFQINIITLNIFAFMLRAAGPFAAFALGLVWRGASKTAGLISILAGSAVGIYWQILEEPYGILAIVAGSVAGLVAFAITTWIERGLGGREATPLFED